MAFPARGSLVRLVCASAVCWAACTEFGSSNQPGDATPGPDAAAAEDGSAVDGGGSDGSANPDTAIVDLAAGNSSTCIVVANGSVYCWGANHRKQLGATTAPETCADARPCSRRPLRVDGITDAKRVAVGDAWACVAHATGAVSCWGSNAHLQLGHSTGDESCGGVSCNATPVAVTGLPAGDAVVQLAAGGDETRAVTCARLQSGKVYCWGRNDVGQLGSGDLSPGRSATPVRVQGIDSARFLTAAPQGGNLGLCVVLESNELSCWGAAEFWMIGRDPDSETCRCFAEAGEPSIVPDANIATIGIADGTSVIARTDGSVAAFGFAGYAVKPLGNLPEAVTPIPGLPSTVVEIAAGARHACARTSTNDVWCWGDAHLGSLGRGSFAGQQSCNGKPCSESAAMLPDAKGTRLVAGVNGTFLLAGEHRILAWGANQYGQLGHAAALDVESVEGLLCAARPVEVEGLP
ncbi:MAG: hypothetical protein KF764_00815 [Labilithrix sp.]|nr:hypothetical protein [Labilithrix sp.]